MLRKLIIETFEKPLDDFYKQTFKAISGFSLTILGALAGIWVAYLAYRAFIEGRFELGDTIKKVLIFSTLATLLSANNSMFHNYIYQPIKETTNALVSRVVSVSVKNHSNQGAAIVVDKLQAQYGKLWDLVVQIKEKAGLLDAATAGFIALGLLVLFTGSEAVYALYLVGNSMKLAAIGALSPLLIVAFVFNATRGHAIGALKYLLNSALTLIIASFCVGLVLTTLQNVYTEINSLTIDSSAVFIALGTLFVVSLCSIYFLLIAPEMASAISGASSGSLLTGMVATVMTAGLGFISSKLGAGFLGSAKMGAGGAWSGVKSLPKIANALMNPQQTAANVAQSVRKMFNSDHMPDDKS